MPKEQLKQAAEYLQDGHKNKARRVLKAVLQAEPSADAWFLAAHAMEKDEQAIACLKKALEIDEWHAGANRMIHKLEKVKSAEERGYNVDTGFQSELEEATRQASEQGQFLQNLFKGFSKKNDGN